MTSGIPTRFESFAAALAGRLEGRFPRFEPGRLARYLADVAEWNERVALVSRRSTPAVVQRLAGRSAEALEFLEARDALRPETARIVDIGAGAGFPGVVWSLLRPGLALTLVERRAKKAAFLEREVAVLRLEGVEVFAGDARELAARQGVAGQYSVAVSFAVAAPEDLAPAVEALLAPGGYYATVRPVAGDAPEVAGKTLGLEAVSREASGRFCLYRRRRSFT